jgi:antitoxin (DNA-binding transcriptional repressor) of toxin-antitoxin stability system
MITVELSDVTALEPHIQPGGTEPILVKSHGKTVAMVVPVTRAEDVEDIVLSYSAHFEAILQRSQQRLASEGSLTSDEVRRRLGIPGSNG